MDTDIQHRPMSLLELPRYRGSRAAVAVEHRPARVLRSDQGIRRRSFIKGAAFVGMAVGLNAVGLLPPARRAKAHHGVMYQIKALPCPPYNFYQTNPNCTPCGPSTIYSGACITDSSAHYYGYHRDNANWDLRPNECTGSTYDGWIWQIADGTTCGAAGCTDHVKYRCHDGWKVESGVRVDRSICKFVCDCDGQPDNCVTD